MTVRQSKAGVVLHLASAVTHIILSWEWCWIWNKVVTIPQFNKKRKEKYWVVCIDISTFVHDICQGGGEWHHHHAVMRSRWNWHYSDRLKWSGLCVLLSVCVDIVPCCVLVCCFMMWPASLQGVPTLSGFGAGSGLYSLDRPFHKPMQTMHSCDNGCQHVYVVWMVKFVEMYMFFLKLFVQCCEFKWF